MRELLAVANEPVNLFPWETYFGREGRAFIFATYKCPTYFVRSCYGLDFNIDIEVNFVAGVAKRRKSLYEWYTSQNINQILFPFYMGILWWNLEMNPCRPRCMGLYGKERK